MSTKRNLNGFSQTWGLQWLTFLKAPPLAPKFLIELSSSSRGSGLRSNLDGMERLAGVAGADDVAGGGGGGIDASFLGLDSALAAKIKLLLAGIVTGRGAGVGRFSSTCSTVDRLSRCSSLA